MPGRYWSAIQQNGGPAAAVTGWLVDPAELNGRAPQNPHYVLSNTIIQDAGLDALLRSLDEIAALKREPGRTSTSGGTASPATIRGPGLVVSAKLHRLSANSPAAKQGAIRHSARPAQTGTAQAEARFRQVSLV